LEHGEKILFLRFSREIELIPVKFHRFQTGPVRGLHAHFSYVTAEKAKNKVLLRIQIDASHHYLK
jgi:hypothetical protein